MQEKIGLTLDLRGIDMVTPVDLLSDGHTPWSKNFRLYAQQSDDRQVAISSRKGPGFYMSPLSEVLDDNFDVTVTDDISIGVTSHVFAQKITIGTSGRLNRLDAKLRRVELFSKAKGPILVSLYSSGDNKPTKLLSQSSFEAGEISDEYEWHTARFLNAPLLAQNDVVYAVFEIQDDGDGLYQLSGNNLDSGSMYSDVSFGALAPVEYSANFKAYITPDAKLKGAYRFNREDGQNTTVAVYGTTLYSLDPVANTWTVVKSGLNALASEYSFARGDGRVFWVNGFDNLMCWDGTYTGGVANVETITDTELPILSMVTFHRDRVFGVAANDKNRLVWSEAPGNPSNSPTNQQWYRAWLSTSFWYIPAPKTGSPITGIISFQDSLTVFTQDNKYIFSGYDRGSFTNRQSTGSKGAIGPRGIVADENYIYFVSHDGFYRFNGSKDENITQERIQPLFDGCPRKQDITPIIWKNKVRWYMASKTSELNDICPLYNPGLGGEWEMDLETYVDRALYYDDADDNGELIEFSSQYAMPMIAEAGYHSLGAPIDFEYRLKYDSFGAPAQKKRLRRYYPILQGVDNTFYIQLMMDKDFENSPRTKDVLLSVNGNLIGDFELGDGTTFGGDKSFQHHRQSYSGSAYYWQLRVARKGVNNRVAFTGAQYKYRTKRM